MCNLIVLEIAQPRLYRQIKNTLNRPQSTGFDDLPAEMLEPQVGTGLAPTLSFIDRAIFLTRKIVLAQTASMHLRRQPCAALGCNRIPTRRYERPGQPARFSFAPQKHS